MENVLLKKGKSTILDLRQKKVFFSRDRPKDILYYKLASIKSILSVLTFQKNVKIVPLRNCIQIGNPCCESKFRQTFCIGYLKKIIFASLYEITKIKFFIKKCLQKKTHFFVAVTSKTSPHYQSDAKSFLNYLRTFLSFF